MSIWDDFNAGLETGRGIGGQIRNQRAYQDGGYAGVEREAARTGDLETANAGMTMARRQRQFEDDERQAAYERMETVAPWARNVVRAATNMANTDPNRARAFLESNQQRFIDFGLSPEHVAAGIAGLTDPDPAVRQQWREQVEAAFSQHQNPEWQLNSGTGQVYAVDPQSGQVQQGGRVEVAPDWQTNGTMPYRITPDGQVITGSGSIPHRPNLYSGFGGDSAYTVLDQAEVEALGLPPGSYQRNNATGQITVLGRQRGQYTDAAALSAQFADRMTAADQTISQLEELYTSPEGVFLAQAGMGNEYERQVRQAQREFVNAILRKESGAVISDNEFASAAQQYFPQPGDSAAVVAQKRQARQRAIIGLRNASQGAYEEWYGEGSGGERPPAEPPTGSVIGSMVGAEIATRQGTAERPREIPAEEWAAMTPEERNQVIQILARRQR